MAKAKPKRKKPAPAKPENGEVSELGRVLREISDRYINAGGKRLTREEIEREVAERRGARY